MVLILPHLSSVWDFTLTDKIALLQASSQRDLIKEQADHSRDLEVTVCASKSVIQSIVVCTLKSHQMIETLFAMAFVRCCAYSIIQESCSHVAGGCTGGKGCIGGEVQ